MEAKKITLELSTVMALYCVHRDRQRQGKPHGTGNRPLQTLYPPQSRPDGRPGHADPLLHNWRADLGMDPSSVRIIDVYGGPAPEADAAGIRTKIEGFLSTLL